MTKTCIPIDSHHLIDIVKPDEEFSLAIYQDLAYQAILDIHQRGKMPVIVGGSGLYIWSVLEGWCIPQVPDNRRFRQELEERAKKEGHSVLYNELLSIDPDSAKTITMDNTRRIIRAMEVFYDTGIPFSQLKKKEDPGFYTIIVGLTQRREDLYNKIDERVDRMIATGLIEETHKLLKKGYSTDLPAMSGIGYKEIALFLKGQMDLADAVRRVKKASRKLVRHQYAWFRLTDARIKWFDITLNDKSTILEWCEDSLNKLLQVNTDKLIPGIARNT